jgi:hypothetical protein
MAQSSVTTINKNTKITIVEESNFRGKDVFVIKQQGAKYDLVKFGIKKADTILDNIDTIHQWVNGNPITTSDDIRIGEYNGCATLGFYNGDELIFNAGASKYKAILNHLDELREWCALRNPKSTIVPNQPKPSMDKKKISGLPLLRKKNVANAVVQPAAITITKSSLESIMTQSEANTLWDIFSTLPQKPSQ